MSSFKFFNRKHSLHSIDELKRYHAKILTAYAIHFNLQPGHRNYNASLLIANTVDLFINDNHLNNFDLIRTYYRIAYEHLHSGDIITDDGHNMFIRDATWERVNGVN